MGFSTDAANKLQLINNKSAGIGSNEADSEDSNLYMTIFAEAVPNAFRISKAGHYYYINTKLLFDNLKLTYSDGSLSFEMSEMEIEGEKVYVLKRRSTQAERIKNEELEDIEEMLK